MDAVKELDLLIEMMRDLLEMPGNPGYKTPVYRCTLPSYVSFPFHNFISSLIDCVGYTQLSNACAKVKAILHDKWHDANEEMANKYQDLWEDLQIFILN